ncbi:hypothetical protein F5H01DRAFT_137690 [Linnemannia elongata]|nr:hypothetical protein F5H01DRAFT_137690 [Linnemannia elongata]
MRDTHTQREQTVREEECAQGYSNTLSRQANRQAVEPRSKSRDPWVTLSLPLSLENHTYATPLLFFFFYTTLTLFPLTNLAQPHSHRLYLPSPPFNVYIIISFARQNITCSSSLVNAFANFFFFSIISSFFPKPFNSIHFSHFPIVHTPTLKKASSSRMYVYILCIIAFPSRLPSLSPYPLLQNPLLSFSLSAKLSLVYYFHLSTSERLKRERE